MTLASELLLLPLAHGFGINTNIIETNVLNLAVVIGVVVTVVGDALRALLDTRRQTILGTLQEAEQKAAEAQARLDQARAALEAARAKATQIRAQAASAAEKEGADLAEQFAKELKRLRDAQAQTVELQRQRAVQQIAQQAARLALNAAEATLVENLVQGAGRARQRELNERHVRDTFRQLKAGSTLGLFPTHSKDL
jgi:F-type H+-transporting ATPase subunit b